MIKPPPPKKEPTPKPFPLGLSPPTGMGVVNTIAMHLISTGNPTAGFPRGDPHGFDPHGRGPDPAPSPASVRSLLAARGPEHRPGGGGTPLPGRFAWIGGAGTAIHRRRPIRASPTGPPDGCEERFFRSEAGQGDKGGQRRRRQRKGGGLQPGSRKAEGPNNHHLILNLSDVFFGSLPSWRSLPNSTSASPVYPFTKMRSAQSASDLKPSRQAIFFGVLEASGGIELCHTMPTSEDFHGRPYVEAIGTRARVEAIAIN